MTGVEGQVLKIVALVNKDMVDAHALEVKHLVLLLFHLVAYGFKSLFESRLPFLKSFEHTYGDVLSLLLENIEVFLHRVKLRLHYFLLQIARLRDFTELVVRHYYAVVVVVLHIPQEFHAVGG